MSAAQPATSLTRSSIRSWCVPWISLARLRGGSHRLTRSLDPPLRPPAGWPSPCRQQHVRVQRRPTGAQASARCRQLDLTARPARRRPHWRHRHHPLCALQGQGVCPRRVLRGIELGDERLWDRGRRGPHHGRAQQNCPDGRDRPAARHSLRQLLVRLTSGECCRCSGTSADTAVCAPAGTTRTRTCRPHRPQARPRRSRPRSQARPPPSIPCRPPFRPRSPPRRSRLRQKRRPGPLWTARRRSRRRTRSRLSRRRRTDLGRRRQAMLAGVRRLARGLRRPAGPL